MVDSGFDVKAMAFMEAGGKAVPHTIKRRTPGPEDVHIKIHWAGICHSDIHQARQEWGPAIFPMVPGHEIAGIVEAVGANVTNFKVGDKAGVGCMVDSCRNCDRCKKGEEQYCKTMATMTYNGREQYSHCPGFNEDPAQCAPTYGGYSQHIVVNCRFVLSIPDSIPFAEAAPLLCAGITVFSPMKHYGVKSGSKIAVAGLGGLGSMAVLIAKGMGCHVTVLSRGTAKKDEAISKLGADDFVDSTDAAAMGAKAEAFSHIVDSIGCEHDVNSLMGTLDIDGKLILLGGNPTPMQISSFGLLFRRKSICGSLIGGIAETQEMLNFCAEKNIGCVSEICKPTEIDAAYNRTTKGDVRYRFVIDCN